MMNQPKISINNSKSFKQSGAATLLVVIVLLLLMGVMALTVNRNTVMEQKMTGNDIRAREAQEAAEAGLNYGVAWAGKNSINWVGNSMICPGNANCPALPTKLNENISLSGEDYNVTSLVYSRTGATSDFIRVTSVATANVDTTITATSSVYIKPGGLLTSEGKIPPPLVMDGCMTSTTGTPDIYPGWTDLDGDGVRDVNEWADADGDGEVDAGEWTDSNGNGTVDNEMRDAIITSQPEFVGGSYCLDYCGPGGVGCPSTTDTDKSHLDLHSGTLTNNQAFPDNDGDGEGTIWEYYFDVTYSQYQAAASTSLSSAGGAYFITSTGNWPGGTYGSPSDPVIIVFANGCPKPSGTTTLYGILFYADENGCVSDPMNGWGAVTVYGSVGANGGIHKMNANLEIYGVGSGTGGMETVSMVPIDASKLPGTWNDF